MGRVLAAGPDRFRHLADREAVPLTGRYRGFLAPLILIAAGLLVLLANLEYVKWESLFRLIDLWPVLLILAGIEVLARSALPPRAAAATGTAAVALALIGSVIYVALAPALPAPSQSQHDYSSRIQGITQATLELDLGAVNLDLRGAPLGEDLYQAHFDFPAGQVPRARLDPSSATVYVESQESGLSWFGAGGHRRAVIKVNDSIPWAIRTNTGASNQTADLAGVQLTRVEIAGGASHVELALGRPSGTVPITITGGADHVVLHRPGGTAARVRVSGGASSLSADGSRYVGQDEIAWESGYAGASDRYDIRIEGGASHVTVDTR